MDLTCASGTSDGARIFVQSFATKPSDAPGFGSYLSLHRNAYRRRFGRQTHQPTEKGPPTTERTKTVEGLYFYTNLIPSAHFFSAFLYVESSRIPKRIFNLNSFFATDHRLGIVMNQSIFNIFCLALCLVAVARGDQCTLCSSIHERVVTGRWSYQFPDGETCQSAYFRSIAYDDNDSMW
jgi:hypothetical protein